MKEVYGWLLVTSMDGDCDGRLLTCATVTKLWLQFLLFALL